MCRLFGFRSIRKGQVHNSLLHAENALGVQSNFHPDGWGVAYYLSGAPHIIKSETAAIEDKLFKKVSGIVSSETVLAHIRKATMGNLSVVNTHPFQYGHWVFAHNGNIRNFQHLKKRLIHKVPEDLSRFILGDTDSELLFYVLLTHLSKRIDLNRADCTVDLLYEASNDALKEVIEEVGDFSEIDNAGDQETYLSFILTNGATMIAFQGGKELNYSIHKEKCPERDTCNHFTKECENPSESGDVNHLIISSEPIKGDNIWTKIVPGEFIGLDWRMKFKKFSLK